MIHDDDGVHTDLRPAPTNRPWRVIICDDHPSSRFTWRDICRNIGCEVIEETGLGGEAIHLVETSRPDLLILDQRLPDMSGIAVHWEIRKRKLPTKVFVMSAYCDSARFFDWISEPDGPDGVLDKAASLYEIQVALTHVLTQGTKYIPPSIWKREQGSASSPLHKLTRHELRVLRDVAMGHKLPEIAARQHLAFNTVRSYMNDIYCKLELPSNTLQAAAVAYARAVYEGGEERLLEQSDP